MIGRTPTISASTFLYSQTLLLRLWSKAYVFKSCNAWSCPVHPWAAVKTHQILLVLEVKVSREILKVRQLLSYDFKCLVLSLRFAFIKTGGLHLLSKQYGIQQVVRTFFCLGWGIARNLRVVESWHGGICKWSLIKPVLWLISVFRALKQAFLY